MPPKRFKLFHQTEKLRIKLIGSNKTLHCLYIIIETTGIRQGIDVMDSTVMDAFFRSSDAKAELLVVLFSE